MDRTARILVLVLLLAAAWTSPASSAEVSAAGGMPVTVNVVAYTNAYPTSGGRTAIDGFLYSATSVTDVLVTLELRDASDAYLGTVTAPADCHVLDPVVGYFHWEGTAPAGVTHAHPSAVGAYTTSAPLTIAVTGVSSSPGPPRHFWGSATNGLAFPVSGLIVRGREMKNYTPPFPELPNQYLHDVYHDYRWVAGVLSSGGTSTWTWDLYGFQPFSAGPYETLSSSYDVSVVRYAPAPVWRFYNRRTGTHFYTADPSEKASVEANLAAIYSYDGPAYNVNTTSPSNMRPLHRFYNKRTGTHFYTSDETEKASVEANLAAIYSYDGPAYNVSSFPFFSAPVYRFYNTRAGVHFYTADAAERDSVIANLGYIYTYEGPAFYLAY